MFPLQSNLQEIYAFVHDSSDENLVPDLTGTYLYHPKCLWGRVLHVVHWDELVKNQRLCEAFRHTHLAFQLEQIKAEKWLKHYFSALPSATGKACVKPIVIKINAWQITYRPFLKLAQQHHPKLVKLKNLVDLHFLKTSNYEENQLSPPLASSTLYHMLNTYNAIRKLLKVVNFPIPFKDLKILLKKPDVRGIEYQRFKKWIKNKKSALTSFSVNTLYYACLGMITAIFPNSSLEKKIHRVALLIGILFEKQAFPLAELDPKHIKWREGLKNGDRVECNEKILTLGKVKILGDTFSLFNIEENPDQYLMIDRNNAIASQKYVLSKKFGKICLLPKIFEVDLNGTCLIIEKLLDSLGDVEWISREKMEKLDIDYARPLAGLVQWYLEHEIPLADETVPDQFRFNLNGRIINIKFSHYSNFDVTVHEKLLYDTSKQNLLIFQYLMVQSQLNGHPHILFFQSLFQRAIYQDLETICDLAASFGIIKPFTISKGEIFYKSVNRLIKECFNDYKDLATKTMINQALLVTFKETKAGSILWPDLKTRVLKKLQ